MLETIGFIGLGVMGKPMAYNLIKAGYPLVVYNHQQTVTNEFLARGTHAAERPRDVAERSDIVITMLPDAPQVQEVIAGPDGILMGAKGC